jgi:hypothetical protein
VVLFLGVFYHLFDPIAGFEKVAKLARESLIIETHTDGLAFDLPAMVFYPGSELANDASNWWGSNPALMVALLKKFGFAKVDAAWSIRPRAAFHTWRTDSLRRSSDINEHTIPALKRRQKLHRGWRLIREGLGLRRMS